jgi:hypothetical protein
MFYKAKKISKSAIFLQTAELGLILHCRQKVEAEKIMQRK